VDGPDILAENADEEKLHRAEKEESDFERCQAEAETVPVKELENQVAEGDEQAQERDGEAEHGGQSEGHLRVIGNAEHRHVVEAVKVVAGDTAFPHRLAIGDFRDRKTDFGNQPAEIGIGIVDFRDNVDEAAVVEAEAGCVFVQLDFGQAADDFIIEFADGEEDRRLLAFLFDGDDDEEAFLPLFDEF